MAFRLPEVFNTLPSSASVIVTTVDSRPFISARAVSKEDSQLYVDLDMGLLLMDEPGEAYLSRSDRLAQAQV